MGRKPIGENAMSKNERWDKWYQEHKEESNRRRVITRMASGAIPTDKSMTRYRITREELNAVRSENGLPVLYSDSQVTIERGMIQKNKGGTKTYVQAIPIAEPVPQPGVFAPPSKVIENVVKYGKGGEHPGLTDEEWDRFTSPFGYKDLEQCIEMYHPVDKPNDKGPYAAATIHNNITGATKAMQWWAERIKQYLKINVDFTEDDDINKWIDDNAQRIHSLAPKIKRSDFPSQDPKMKLNEAVKKKVTAITGAISYCRSWGMYMEMQYPKAVNLLRKTFGEAKGKEKQEMYDRQEQLVAKSWAPVAARAAKAVKNRPGPKAELKAHYDYILLQMWASEEGHPLRDQMGKVRIVQSKSDMAAKKDVHIQYNVDTGKEERVHDYYVMNTNEFVWRSHKTRTYTGEVTQKAPKGVQGAILTSLQEKKHKRDWLITKRNDITQPYGKASGSSWSSPA